MIVMGPAQRPQVRTSILNLRLSGFNGGITATLRTDPLEASGDLRKVARH